jgi:hypothetical protein
MRKLVREVQTFVRRAGGSNVWISEGGRHTRVNFTADGRDTFLLIHRGNIVTSRFPAMIRSQLRRKTAQ